MNRDRSKRRNVGGDIEVKEQGRYILEVRGDGGKTKDEMMGRQKILPASLEKTEL